MTQQELQNNKTAEYLGDGVYITDDGWALWLHTSNGEEVTNSIALEPEVLLSFASYLERRSIR